VAIASFGCATKIGRFLCMADVGKSSARLIYGSTAQDAAVAGASEKGGQPEEAGDPGDPKLQSIQ
jgi:hypothetical protein